MRAARQYPYVTPALERAAKILRTLAEVGKPLGLSEICRLLHLPKSSVFRIILTLEADGWLERVGENQFFIGPTVFYVGNAYARHSDLHASFYRVAQRLVSEHGETVQMAILAGNEVLYIGKVESTQTVRLASTVGTRLPAHATSLGKALLSTLTDGEVRALYPDGHLVTRTASTISSLDALLADLAEVRRRGWSVDLEETTAGVQCVGSPIYGVASNETGRAVAALSISVPLTRMEAGRISKLGQAVRSAAAEISMSMGYEFAVAPVVLAAASGQSSESIR